MGVMDAGALSLIVLCLFYLVINYMMASARGDWTSEIRWSAILVAVTVVGVIWIQARGGSSVSPWVSWAETLLPIGFFAVMLLLTRSKSR